MKRYQLTLIIFAVASLSGMHNVFAANGVNPTNVKITEITPKKLNIFKSYVGYLKPQNRVMVRSETSGTVEKIHVDEGVKVKAGQVLVHVSTNELELRKTIAKTNYNQAVSNYQVEKNLYLSNSDKTNADSASKPVYVSLKQLRLQADMAKADYEHALTEYEVQKRLYDKDMASATTYDSYKTTLEIKRITWEQAELQWEQARIKDKTHLENFENAIKINEANLKLAALELDKSKVKAPFSGIVKEKIVQMGGFIQSGSDLFELMDISNVLVRINIPEMEMRFAAVGKAVSIRLEAMPGEEFQGTIKTLGLEADIKCRCFPAEVVIENKQQRLLPGMMAKVKMLAFADSNQVIIPRHAVLEKLKGSVVFVVRNGKAVQVPVVPGEMIEENVQIVSGLNFGDRLIVVGQDLLANNEPVTVVNKNHKLARR